MTQALAIIPLAFVVGILLLARFRPAPTLNAVRDGFSLPIGVLGDAHEALAKFITTSRRFWCREFGEQFGVRPLWGGLLGLLFSSVFTVADWHLLALGWEVALGGSAVCELPVIGRQPIPGLIALSAVGLAIISAGFFLDLAGVATFFRWPVSPTTRKIGLGLCFLLLLAACTIQGAIAIARAREQERVRQATQAEQILVLESDGPSVGSLESSPSGSPSSDSFWDRFPIWAQGALGFLLPLAAGILGAMALHATIMGLSGLGVAAVIGVVVVVAAGVRLSLNLMARAAAFAESVLRLMAPMNAVSATTGSELPGSESSPSPVPPGSSTILTVSGATPSVVNGLRVESSAESEAASGWSAPPAPILTEIPSTEEAEPNQSADLAALRAALQPNPLDVPEDLLGDPVDGGNQGADTGGRATDHERLISSNRRREQ